VYQSSAILESPSFRRNARESPAPTFTQAMPAAKSHLKRALDVFLSAGLLMALAPLIALIALAVRLTSRGPVFFVQKRVGYQGVVFDMLKFRSMHQGADQVQAAVAAQVPERTFLKIENDPRITVIGRWLRVSSLDELPQLVNVLSGDMSLVGPRPILLCDLDKFPRGHQMRRFTAKPGMTGLWQVSGRSQCNDHERIQLDLVYVDCWSHELDLAILARTVPTVLSGAGAY
jgi:lipopolysaccharide/colanic/teichoic acid biosynthesis glycosyltransferase